MDRAYESNAVGAAPAPPDPPLLGYPSETSPATVPGAWWFYMITEELRAAVVAGGLVPNATNVGQVAAAIAAIAQSVNIAWAKITGVPSSASAVANTLALRDGSAGLTAASFNVSSDSRLKENIRPITGALGRLDSWRGITYRHKRTGAQLAGVVAQDFANVRPESVTTELDEHGEEGPLRVSMMGAVAELLEALREERDARKALEARLAALENR